jgi:hypothetical protein
MFCYEYNSLLEHNLAASSNYHRAITKLVQLAGQNEPVFFEDARRLCATYLEECRRTSDALHRHQSDHGC